MSKQLPYLDDCPLAVDIRRGGYVESTHLVDIAVVDSDGRIILGYGETERPVFPRSAMKPLQALVLVEQLQQAGLTRPFQQNSSASPVPAIMASLNICARQAACSNNLISVLII